MNELQALTLQRDELLAKIREIEASCEGIENENNAQRVQQLNLEQAQLTAKKQELSAKLSALNSRLSAISAEITSLSGTGVDRILDAIKNQRWFFFKNKTKVLMDRNTGFLWANLNYFNWCKNKNNLNETYSTSEAKNVVSSFSGDNFSNWIIPLFDDFKEMIRDKSFPFQSGDNYFIQNTAYFYCNMTGYG
ncbi:MAG: hypothetical protein K2H26_01230, partial [Ruminococcus sp.]|nr:hypothetical protein [Ruminococcus sp.]